MKNSNENAFPYRSFSHSEYGTTEENNFGLTKREYFAIKCLQGLLNSNTHQSGIYTKQLASRASRFAIEYADDLLRQLEETQ
jgi:hypothetical protein